MSKQEKRDKADKKAKKKAKVLVDITTLKVMQRVDNDGNDIGDPVQLPDGSLAQQVKELRDGGMAWWMIGQELGLMGKANSAVEGKPGASKARTLYKKASGGTLPPTARAGKGSRPNRLEKALGEGPRPRGRRGRDALLIDHDAASMFTDEHSDEDIANMLRGKRITFVNSMSGEADTMRVRSHSPVEIIHTPNGRAVQFRQSFEDDHACDPKFRFMPGHMRTVIVDRIVRIAA
jgi:hypothetical protein